MALNLEEDNVGAVILGNASLIKREINRATGKVVSVLLDELLGRVISALGDPVTLKRRNTC